MFCWMMVEGLRIYVSLVKVFEKGHFFKRYLLVGWGRFVALTDSIDSVFSTERFSEINDWEKFDVSDVAFTSRKI